MKNILLGVTGGIAAFKSASIVSLLKKKGCYGKSFKDKKWRKRKRSLNW